MADEIIKELWKIKDDIAKEFGYDVKVFVSKLRANGWISQSVSDWLHPVVQVSRCTPTALT